MYVRDLLTLKSSPCSVGTFFLLGGWLALCLLYQKSGLLMCGEPYEKFQRMLSWIRDTWAPASGRDCFSLSNKVVSLLSALEEFYLKDCTWL
jgi:hypothetical protein